jgi:hypothetical protein
LDALGVVRLPHSEHSRATGRRIQALFLTGGAEVLDCQDQSQNRSIVELH